MAEGITMPRQARIDSSGALHHIICRGIERCEIFKDDIDRDDFISRLGKILIETSTSCHAWALIPNHFHVLLQTGRLPIATVMRRLLTGYATKFNNRHNRHGHLFENRYKSILCQEEPYLLELTRYIHLNPLRAGIVSSLDELRTYRYCGHRRILGRSIEPWMSTSETLAKFGRDINASRKAYETFIADGVGQGKREDLTGGGLLRSSGGWRAIMTAREAGLFLKSDERILGDSDFVADVLNSPDEEMERKTAYQSHGVDLDKLSRIVSEVLNIDIGEIATPGRQPRRVQARSLFCYWAVRELGVATTTLARRFNLTQPAISLAIARGEKLVTDKGWCLEDFIKD
jgi:putative transposase